VPDGAELGLLSISPPPTAKLFWSSSTLHPPPHCLESSMDHTFGL
jgi:hypothetical protein